MRTNNKVFIVLIIMLLSIFNTFSISNHSYADSSTSAKAMVVLDANSKRILFDKNCDQKLPMASTTKIVTALTVLDNCNNINKEIIIDNRAVGISGTSIYLKQSEKLTIKELLYGLMLPSGNDAATALAYAVGGDIESFCDMMKKTAINCGACNSNFKNPHGLDQDGHYTTAKDLALITAKALEDETFYEIVTTKSTRIKGSTEGAYRYLKNKNKLLNTLDGCIGVKTGFTNNAGRCLVSAVHRNNLRAICVVLNCGPMFEESAKLLNDVYNTYSNIELLAPYKIIRSIRVEDGKLPFIKVYTKRGFMFPLTNEEAKQLEFKYDIPNTLQAPVQKDTIVGELKIYLNNCLLFSEKIYTIDNIQKIGVWSNIQDIISNW